MIRNPIGLPAAIGFLEQIALHNIQNHQHQLPQYALQTLSQLHPLTIYPPNHPPRLLTFNIQHLHPHHLPTLL
ncbi:aminotransferase class V-fold PLP-dependent enzyme, partial [Bacillus thuringiensis]|uniref:aminotransferase class V-fold PLP-dependent enzyme n=1 Tax=Bacillus thuringiensis TaxID=1428 RepID=UPI003D6D7468